MSRENAIAPAINTETAKTSQRPPADGRSTSPRKMMPSTATRGTSRNSFTTFSPMLLAMPFRCVEHGRTSQELKLPRRMLSARKLEVQLEVSMATMLTSTR